MITQQNIILLNYLSISDVFEDGFTKMPMNVLNVDLDDKGDFQHGLNLINTLRKCVFDFKTKKNHLQKLIIRENMQ